MKKQSLKILSAGILLVAHAPFAAVAQQGKPAASATVVAAKPTASAPLAALFDEYWDEQARLFPLGATAQGDNRYNDQLPNDQTQAFRARQRAFYQQYLTALRKLDRARLSAGDQVNYDIFDYDMQIRLDGLKLHSWMMPFAQFYSLPNSLVQLAARPCPHPAAPGCWVRARARSPSKRCRTTITGWRGRASFQCGPIRLSAISGAAYGPAWCCPSHWC